MEIKNEIGMDFIFERLKPSSIYGLLYLKECSFDFTKEELFREYFYLENVANIIKDKNVELKVIREIMKNIKNILGSLKRLKNDEYLCEIELFEIKNFNLMIKKLLDTLRKYNWKNYSEKEIKFIEEVKKILDPNDSGNSSFFIYSEYSKKLKDIRLEIDDLIKNENIRKLRIKKYLEENYSIKIKQDNQIIIDKRNSELVNKISLEKDVIYHSEDYLNIRFKISDKEEFKEKLNELKLLETNEETEVLKEITKKIKKHVNVLVDNTEEIGKLDFRIAKAIFSNSFNLVKPNIISENRIRAISARHLKTEFLVGKENYTPIDIEVNKGVTLITGANMGGKTVNLKLLAQCTIMAQMGMFVPCNLFEFSPREFIVISSGDEQSIESGLSTFGSEIIQIKKALDMSDKNGLILIDEIARGTNPLEGTAISKAIVEFLKDKNSISVITTHFEGVSQIEGIKKLQVVGLNKSKLKEIYEIKDMNDLKKIQELMDYRLIEIDKEIPKDAIEISKLLGLKKEIIDSALGYLEEETKI